MINADNGMMDVTYAVYDETDGTYEELYKLNDICCTESIRQTIEREKMKFHKDCHIILEMLLEFSQSNCYYYVTLENDNFTLCFYAISDRIDYIDYPDLEVQMDCSGVTFSFNGEYVDYKYSFEVGIAMLKNFLANALIELKEK